MTVGGVVLFSHCVKSVQIRSFFSPNAGKYGPEKIPYLDTFHAVKSLARNEKFISTEASDLVFWRFKSTKNAEFEQELISLEERVDQDRIFTYVLRQTKMVLFCLYYLSGRIHRFLRKSVYT